MYAKRLKELLAKIDDDVLIVRQGSDHSFQHINSAFDDIVVAENRAEGLLPTYMFEDDDGELEEGQCRRKVFILG